MVTIAEILADPIASGILLFTPGAVYVCCLIWLIKKEWRAILRELRNDTAPTILAFLVITAIMISPGGWLALGYMTRACFKDGPCSIIENKSLREQNERLERQSTEWMNRCHEAEEEYRQMELQVEESQTILRDTGYLLNRLARNLSGRDRQYILNHIEQFEGIMSASRAKPGEFGNDISKEIDDIKHSA